jgi:Do/DeqQ family serine protease
MIRSLIFAILVAAAPAIAQPDPQLGGTDRIVPESEVQLHYSFAPIVRQAAPAVVNVYSRRVVQQRASFFNRSPAPQEQNSGGSGVIVDASGVIVTNFHVVEGADELRVVLADRREFEATILLTDERTDLAVLKVETDEPLPVLPFDPAGEAEVGDIVLAIGNPFGVGQTVTSGIVSALARTDVGQTDFASFIQTDAAINPGNSGGALVDMDGELIGVNSMIFSRSGGSNGIGFAIPVEMVRRVVDSALTESELIRPWLGARLQPVTSDLAEVFGLDRPRGALVNEVFPGAAADDAGLLQGDVILSIDEVDVYDEPGARFRLATHAAGDDARFTILRSGALLDVDVAVIPAPGLLDPERYSIDGRNPLAGASLVRLSPAFSESIGLDPFVRGVIVVTVQRRSVAGYLGFRPGDLLVELNGVAINELSDVSDVLDSNAGLKDWPVVIERQGRRYEQTLRL